MKKLFIILLCLCTLTACGKNDYEELITMLDEGKYTEAVDYINKLAYEDAKDNGTVDSKNGHIEYLYGAWEYSGSSNDATTYDIIINNNGTCTINGTEYLWTINNENDTYLSIDILEGASKAYRFELSYNKDNPFHQGYFSFYNESTTGYDGLGFYRNRDHYEIIELTTDNWIDYFELATEVKFHKDAFGETSSCSYTEYYKLKDEYADRLNSNYNYSKIAYELMYENGRMMVNYDLDKETFELVEFVISESHPDGNTTGTMSTYSYNSNENYYGFNVMSGTSPSTLTTGEQVIYNYRNNPVMTRIQGELMFWKGLD